MDNKKIIVALLLITVILSIVSVAITLGLDATEMSKQDSSDFFGVQSGNVQLVIEQTPETREVPE